MSKYWIIAIGWVLGVSLSAAGAATYDVAPGQNVVGTLQYIEADSEDTLLKIAYEFDLGYEELLAANPGLDVWKPGQGERVILPTRFILPPGKRKGIYINVASYRLYYYPAEYKGRKVATFPISVGRGDWPTPKKSALVVDKLVDPAWYPPPAVRAEHEEWGDPLPKVVPPGEDNPLGKYALQLNLPGYFIHGTNKPYGIGMNVTHGCVRLRPADIAYLFPQVSRKTPVRIIDDPYLMAIQSDVIYLEAHPGQNSESKLLRELTDSIRDMLRNAPTLPAVDWQRLVEITEKGYGFPQVVSRNAGDTEPVKVKRRKAITQDGKPGKGQNDKVRSEYLF